MKYIVLATLAGMTGLVLAQQAPGRIVVERVIPDKAPSGSTSVFAVRTKGVDITRCNGVYIRKQGDPHADSKKAGLVSAMGNVIRFQAMVVRGEEGVYDVFLCGSDRPQTQIAMEAPPQPARKTTAATQPNAPPASSAAPAEEDAITVAKAAENRSRQLSAEVRRLRTTISNMQSQVNGLNRQLENKANAADLKQVVESNLEMNKTLQQHNSNLNKVYGELSRLSQNLDSVRTTANNSSGRTDQLSRDLAELRRQTARLAGIQADVANTQNYDKGFLFKRRYRYNSEKAQEARGVANELGAPAQSVQPPVRTERGQNDRDTQVNSRVVSAQQIARQRR